jgi:hypothetical protein
MGTNMLKMKKIVINIASITLFFFSTLPYAGIPADINLSVQNNSNYRIMIMPRLTENAFHILDPANKKEILLNKEEDRFVAICWGANPSSSSCITDFNDPIKACYMPTRIVVTGDLAKRNIKVNCFDRNWV